MEGRKGPNGGDLMPTPNWCMDCTKIPALLGNFAIQGFHPKFGHCLISENYGFTQVHDDKFSIITYRKPPMEFGDAQSLVDWCEKEKLWFLDPNDAYTMVEDDNT